MLDEGFGLSAFAWSRFVIEGAFWDIEDFEEFGDGCIFAHHEDHGFYFSFLWRIFFKRASFTLSSSSFSASNFLSNSFSLFSFSISGSFALLVFGIRPSKPSFSYRLIQSLMVEGYMPYFLAVATNPSLSASFRIASFSSGDLLTLLIFTPPERVFLSYQIVQTFRGLKQIGVPISY